MDKNELWKQIQKTEDLFDRRRLKRFVLTVLFYNIVFTAFEYWRSDLSLLDIPVVFLAYLFFTVPFVLFSAIIFYQLFSVSKSEDRALEFLNKMLEEEGRRETRKQKELKK